MMEDLHVTDDPSKIGFYSGLIVRLFSHLPIPSPLTLSGHFRTQYLPWPSLLLHTVGESSVTRSVGFPCS